MGRMQQERPPDSPEVTRNGAVIAIAISLLFLVATIWLDRLGDWFRIGTSVLGLFGGIGIATSMWTLVVGQRATPHDHGATASAV